MNKIFNLITIFFLSTLLVTSCEKEPILEVSQSSFNFSDQGSNQTISFSTNKDWSASVSGGTWCTISPASGSSGVKSITVSVAANDTYDDRSATITLKAEELTKVITINQPKKKAILLTKDRYEVGPDGGIISVELKSNIDYIVTIPTENQSWITNTTTKGLVTSNLTFTIAANTTYDDRSASITIKAEELTKVITINQPKNKAILLTKDRYEVGPSGGSISVELRSNIEYDVTIPTENQNWITNTTSTTKGLATSNLTFTIAANTTYDSRQGKIIIKEKTSTLSDTVYVSQSQKGAIILTTKTYNVADTAITISVELISNVSYLVTIPSAAQLWITQVQTKALITEQLQFNIAKNTAFESRSSEIIIRQSLLTLADTLYINQAKAPNVPAVTTYDVSNVTENSVSTGGNITSDGGAVVKARGVCWSTNVNPTTKDSITINGSGIGSFTSSISRLIPATTYYLKAYATNRIGTAYGNQVTFSTSGIPTITTASASEITTTSATSGGNISSAGGSVVTARGVCWSTSQVPTISDSKTTDGMGTGSFTSSITGLSPGTTYYVRAYATNIIGTSYGNELSFTTFAQPTQRGADQPTITNRHIAVIVIDFPDTPQPIKDNYFPTIAALRDTIFNGRIKKYLNDMSYGQFTLTGDVFGYFTHQNPGFVNGRVKEMEDVMKINTINIPGLDVNKYDGFLFVPIYDAGLAVSWGGIPPFLLNGNLVNKPGLFVSINIGYYNRDLINYPNIVNTLSELLSYYMPIGTDNGIEGTSSINFSKFNRVFAHEFFHFLKLPHANSRTNGTSYDYEPEVPNNNCKCYSNSNLGSLLSMDYGNKYDIMGKSEYGNSLNMAFRDYFGWTNSNNKYSIKSYGHFTTTITPLNSLSGIRTVEIRIPYKYGIFADSKNQGYYLEVRTGNNKWDKMLLHPQLQGNNEGIMVIKTDGHSCDLLDLSPSPNISYYGQIVADIRDVVIKPGMIYLNSEIKLSNVIKNADGSFTIDIDILHTP